MKGINCVQLHSGFNTTATGKVQFESIKKAVEEEKLDLKLFVQPVSADIRSILPKKDMEHFQQDTAKFIVPSLT